MSKKSKVRSILLSAIVGITGTLIFFCLVSVLLAYFFPVPPKIADLLMVFSPPPPKALDFSKVDEIIIDDSYTGLALFTSYNNHYKLKTDQGQVIGEANFSVSVFDPIQASAPLVVSVDEVKKFSDLLAQSKLERGIYIPNINHSDDYPKIEIVLRSRNKEVASFSSISQEETHIPWKVSINGNSYIVKSDIPARALQELKRNLRQDVLKSLIDQAEK